MEYSAHNDTINCWVRQHDVMAIDTLGLTLRYEETDDSTNLPHMRTDTLWLTPRKTYSTLRKEQEKAMQDWLRSATKPCAATARLCRRLLGIG